MVEMEKRLRGKLKLTVQSKTVVFFLIVFTILACKLFSSFFSFLCQAMLILHPLLSVFVMPTPELHFCVTFGSFLFLHNALFFPLSVFCYHSLLP